MMKEIDARGMACPAPVLQTKDALEKEILTNVNVLVDNEAAKENVIRFLESRDYIISVQQDGSDFHVTGKRIGQSSADDQNKGEQSEIRDKKIMVMVTTDHMGHGDKKLGAKLMVNFLKTLKEMGNELWRVVFLNNGVKLTVQGAGVVPVLSELQEKEKVTILVCGTCLTHFGLLDKKKVGETTNMLDIVTSMQLADKVISI